MGDLLVDCDEIHEEDAQQEGHHLLHRLPQRRVLQQLRNHGHRSDVDETTCSEWEDGRGGGCIGETRISSNKGQHTSRESSRCRHQLHAHRLSPRVSRLDEDGEVSDLMGNLVHKHCDHRHESNCRSCEEGSSDGESVREVVGEISDQIEISCHFVHWSMSFFLDVLLLLLHALLVVLLLLL
ncbi:hypothetical protein PMAYCL1PPCAC_02955, partial [Pristionchus mayeri]